jgi:threonine dehydrogenase-like Zn-dependent dehydrogenase
MLWRHHLFALKKLGSVIYDELVLVIGAGGLGLMCVSVLEAMGGKGAVVIDIDKKRREAALAVGAFAAIDGAAPDALARIAETLTGPCWAAIDLVGSPSTGWPSTRSPGRQAHHGRPLWRGCPVALAFYSDKGRDNLGKLNRKPHRDQGAARSRARGRLLPPKAAGMSCYAVAEKIVSGRTDCLVERD